MIRRTKNQPLPPSVRVYPDVPWVEPADLRPRWWQRLLYGTGLIGLVGVLGIALAISIGLLILAAFFAMEFIIG